MADAHRAAGDGVDRGAVGAAVVGDQSLDADAVTREERDGAAQEADRGRRLLVVENFDVGQAGAVVDRDVDELPALLELLAGIALCRAGRPAAAPPAARPGHAAEP